VLACIGTPVVDPALTLRAAAHVRVVANTDAARVGSRERAVRPRLGGGGAQRRRRLSVTRPAGVARSLTRCRAPSSRPNPAPSGDGRGTHQGGAPTAWLHRFCAKNQSLLADTVHAFFVFSTPKKSCYTFVQYRLAASIQRKDVT
jgi:hypothetical protein